MKKKRKKSEAKPGTRHITIDKDKGTIEETTVETYRLIGSDGKDLGDGPLTKKRTLQIFNMEEFRE